MRPRLSLLCLVLRRKGVPAGLSNDRTQIQWEKTVRRLRRLGGK